MTKKGFTLIELLAVIVILAIIALIAVPIVLNIISDTKEQASLRSADFYLEAVETAIANYVLDGSHIPDGNYNILESGNVCISYHEDKNKCKEELKVEVKGEVFKKGEVTIKSGQIDEVSLVKDNKIIEKNNKGELDTLKIKEPKSFADDTWDTIIANVKIGNTSVYEKNLKENTNNTKTITLTDIGKRTVRIANVSTEEECNSEGFSQTACGFVVEFVDYITGRKMHSGNTSVGGWRDSELRGYINNYIFNSFPENLRKNILTTYTVSGHGNHEGETNFITYDKLYLLSTKEVWGENTSSDTAKNETRQLDYYKINGVTTDQNTEFASKSTNNYWWLRTVNLNSAYGYLVVDNEGKLQGGTARSIFLLTPAFRL